MPPTTRAAANPKPRKDTQSLIASDALRGRLVSPEPDQSTVLPTPSSSVKTPGSLVKTPGSSAKKRKKRASGPDDDEDDDRKYAMQWMGLPDDTDVALRVAGYHEEPATAEDKWCYCGMTGDTEIDLDDMIRCANRQCDPGWFHLQCAKLPSMPPPHFGWFCSACIKRCHIANAVKGLIRPNKDDGSKDVRDWLLEQKKTKVSETKKTKRKRGMWAASKKASNSSEGETDE